MNVYQNASRTATEAVFIRVQPGVDGASATVRCKQTTYKPVQGAQVAMVTPVVRLVVPVTQVIGDLSVTVDESVEIRCNVRKNATNIPDLLVEASRILTESLSEYHLAAGLIPPSEARFESE